MLPHLAFRCIENAGRPEAKETVAVLKCIGSLRTPGAISHYASKPGWQLVGFHFPETPDFADARARCNELMGYAEGRKAIEERDALAQKVAELEAKIAKRGEKNG